MPAPSASKSSPNISAASARYRRRRGPKTQARGYFGLCSRAFSNQDAPSQGAWNLLGSRMTPPMTGRNAFISLNLSRGQSVPLLTEAPPVPDVLPFLGAPTLSVALPAAYNPHAKGTPPAVTLHNDRAVDGTVQVFFAPPRVPSPGVRPRDKDFVLCGTLPALPQGDINLTNLLLTRRIVPGSGWQVFVRLVPLSPNGFRGQPVDADAVAR